MLNGIEKLSKAVEHCYRVGVRRPYINLGFYAKLRLCGFSLGRKSASASNCMLTQYFGPVVPPDRLAG